MCSLASFPAPPPEGCVTLFERDGHLRAGLVDEWSRFCDQLSLYPRISVACEVGRPPASNESAKNAFLRRHESMFKQAVLSWYERGFVGFLQELADSKEAPSYARVMAKSLMIAFRWTHSLHRSIFPHLLLSVEAMSRQFSAANDWLCGQVRTFAWHPETRKCAVASRSDIVRIYAMGIPVVPMLKHKSQRNITALAWRPCCSSTLAVACQDGILLWQVASLIARPSSASATLLSRDGHQPVTSISWHPDGSLLASASVADTSMLVWNVSTEECQPLRRLGGGGVALVRWSPDGSRLLAATPASLFRVWETMSWTCESWSTFLGRCSAACWSPDGCRLLCAHADKAAIYSLTFDQREDSGGVGVGGSVQAVPLVDLTQVQVPYDVSNTLMVGGSVQDMAWSGERLAVSFKDNPQCVAVFRTRTKPILEVNPCGFVRGPPQEHVQFMSFFDGFEGGSLLSICWSSGMISHVPLYYYSDSSTGPAFFLRNLDG
ncbi:aladin-like [Ornithodoros turicata]|uniref:aladin-like n=1 Tax=Ornithodoros turicata TaxID=34597 RepID=UPI003139D35B